MLSREPNIKPPLTVLKLKFDGCCTSNMNKYCRQCNKQLKGSIDWQAPRQFIQLICYWSLHSVLFSSLTPVRILHLSYSENLHMNSWDACHRSHLWLAAMQWFCCHDIDINADRTCPLTVWDIQLLNLPRAVWNHFYVFKVHWQILFGQIQSFFAHNYWLFSSFCIILACRVTTKLVHRSEVLRKFYHQIFVVIFYYRGVMHWRKSRRFICDFLGDNKAPTCVWTARVLSCCDKCTRVPGISRRLSPSTWLCYPPNLFVTSYA